MATQLFKDGNSIWVETHQVNAHLQNGWSGNDPNATVRHPDTILTDPESERTILVKMGILPPREVPPQQEGPIVRMPEPIAELQTRPKRKYTRRASA